MVSCKWVATLCSPEETSTQVETCFLTALEAEGLLDQIDRAETEQLHTALLCGEPDKLQAVIDDTDSAQLPMLLAVSDNGPQMRSHSTREFLAGVHIAQHFGRPHTPTDQASIETLFGHVKGEWPHLAKETAARSTWRSVSCGARSTREALIKWLSGLGSADVGRQ